MFPCPMSSVGGEGKTCVCNRGRETFLICDPCKDSLPECLWLRFAASELPERTAAGYEIERFLDRKLMERRYG